MSKIISQHTFLKKREDELRGILEKNGFKISKEFIYPISGKIYLTRIALEFDFLSLFYSPHYFSIKKVPLSLR